MSDQLQLEAEQLGMSVDEYMTYLAEMAELSQAIRDLTQAVKDLTSTVAMHAANTQLQVNRAQWSIEKDGGTL